MFTCKTFVAAAFGVVLSAGMGQSQSGALGAEAGAAPGKDAGKAGSGEAKRTGPLAALPSAPGGHLARIKAMGDKTWLQVGKAAPDPKWGCAPGRQFASKMAYAPDLGGAFLYGEANHAIFRKDGYVQDGLWFYDLNAHAWICCYPGTKVEDAGLKLNKDGYWENAGGQAVPVTVMHSYNGTTYDPERGLFAAVKAASYYSYPKIKGLDKPWKSENPKGSPWMWNTRTGLWERENCKNGVNGGYGMCLMYVPTMKGFWLRSSGKGVRLYDVDRKDWQGVAVKGPDTPFGYDAQAVYDPKRDRIYLGGGQYPTCKNTESLWIYDVKKQEWSNARAENSRLKTYGSNYAVANFDTVNDCMIVFYHSERKMYVYHAETNRWDDPVDLGGPANKWAWNGFYDPANNAHIFYIAPDNNVDDGRIWAYRQGRGQDAGGQKAR